MWICSEGGDMKRLSIKSKITLYFTSGMILIVILAFSAILLVSGITIERNYKRQLQDVVESNIGEIEYENGRLDFDEDFVPYKYGIFVFVYDENGNMISGEEHDINTEGIPLQERGIYEIELENQYYYAYDVLVSIKDYGNLWLRGIAPKEEMHQSGAIDTIIKISFFTLPVLTILAAVIGYSLTKHSFKPIEKMINSVERIAEGKDLSQRLEMEQSNDEIYRLANSFDKMFERLEDAFEAEKKFTSDASHELRTPTAVILAQCEYVLDGEKTNDEYKEALEVIERQGFKMSKLIAQLLAFTRLDQQTQAIHKETINLSELVVNICEEQAYLQIKDITIKSNIQPNIYAYVDQTLMSRLVINLITNAYQYGKENGHIFITLNEKMDSIYLTVTDDGMGIKQEDINKIWGRFYRVDESRNQGGSYSMGLGLSMVKQIAALHGGRVEVKSTFGKGSEFELILKK